MSWLVSISRSCVVLLSGASAIQLLLNAAAAAIATAVLGPHERGVMVLGVTSASIAAVVSVLGSGLSLRAQLPRAADSGDRRMLVCAFTWVSIGGVGVAALLAGATTAMAARLIDPALGRGLLLFATAAYGAGQLVMLQTTDLWFADGRFRPAGLSSAGGAAGGLAGLLLMSEISPSAELLLLGQALGQLAVGLVVAARLWRAGLLVIARPDPASARKLVLHGTPALGMTVGLAIALRADRYVLGIVSGTAPVGIYSLAATMSETARLVPQAIGQSFMHDAAQGAGSRQLLGKCLWACASSAAAAAIIAIAAQAVVIPLFGPAFDDARGLLLIFLLVAEIAFAPYAVASRGVLGGGWTRSAAMIGILASSVAIVMYALGVEIGGSLGLAISCIGVYGFLSAVAVGTFWRKWGRQVLTTSITGLGKL